MVGAPALGRQFLPGRNGLAAAAAARGAPLGRLPGAAAKWFGKHFAWLPVIAVTFITSIYAIRHGVYALTGETYEHAPWPYIFFYESIKLVLFSGAVAGASSSAWRASRCGSSERERLLELQKPLAESQLAQLKAQLQPHFLFNALNTISSLMQSDVERADRLLTRLADLLRASLQASAQQRPRCARNGSCWSSTPRIMQERFAGRVTLDLECRR